MATEEFQRGATIDQATNVYTLASTAVLLLGDGRPRTDPRAHFGAWRGTDEMKAVLLRATHPERAARYPTVKAFVDAWQEAAGTYAENWAEEE
jgi:serine/threonine-protein kinase